ncbi:MAG: hypothetical protein J6S10_02840 [Clostridia bacterium]|nr:hypothetical protein [Clostridia bacterium]MBO7250240.1 hypothetical protein [Clostridia bacterium]
MSFDMLPEVIAIPAAFLGVIAAILKIIIKVNKTLCSLELAVNGLKDYIEKQSEKNGNFYSAISDHEIRISNLEYKLQNKE